MLVTGQNPASSEAAAYALLAALKSKPAIKVIDLQASAKSHAKFSETSNPSAVPVISEAPKKARRFA